MTLPTLKSVCIIGGGPLGLSAGYYLSKSVKNRLNITVLESSPQNGGLAGSHLLGNGEYIESYYHHIFKSDYFFYELSQSIGVSNQIYFNPVSVGHYYKERLYKLGGPIDILSESLLSPFNRLRFLLASLFLKCGIVKKFKNETALIGSRKLYGYEATIKIWKPLLQGKFGEFQNQVPMSWLASRIRDRSMKLGYYQGGFHNFYDSLSSACVENGISLNYNSPATSVSVRGNEVVVNGTSYDACLSTIGPIFEEKFFNQGAIEPIMYLGAVCVIYEFEVNPGIPYWTNYCDPSSPVLAVISHRELEDSQRLRNCYPVYSAAYLKPDHALFDADHNKIINDFYDPIQRIAMASSCIPLPRYIKATVYRTRYAQPLINPSIGFPPIQRDKGPLYSASMHSIYPNDRGQNYAIGLGKKFANKILADLY